MKLATGLVLALSMFALVPGSSAVTYVFGDNAACVQVVEGSVGAYYVSIDEPPVGTISVWIYEETNHIDGLQRYDEVCDDTNGLEIASDQILF